MGKIVKLLVALFVVVWCASVAFKGMGPGPDTVFEALLDDPAKVSEFDGFVRKGDGYDVQIRFVAQDDWVRALPYLGFEPADCVSVREIIRFSWMRLAAWPLWRPEELEDAICFQRFGNNKWSPHGRDVLLAEPGGGWVYFAGQGEEHDRAMPETDKLVYPEDQ